MEQTDPWSVPDRGVLEAEAAVLVLHPRFDAALSRFCTGLIGFHSASRQNLALADTIHFSVMLLTIHFDATRQAEATRARLIALCSGGGLAGNKAVRNAIDACLSARLMVISPSREHSRAQVLSPTQALRELLKGSLAHRLAALEMVAPLPTLAADYAARDDVLDAFVSGNVHSFAQHEFRLFDAHPEVRAFMDRKCGYLILLALLESARSSPDGSVPVAINAARLAARLDISRAHIRKTIAAAADRGWLRSDEDLTLTTTSYARLRHWIGLEFAWTRRLVVPDGGRLH